MIWSALPDEPWAVGVGVTGWAVVGAFLGWRSCPSGFAVVLALICGIGGLVLAFSVVPLMVIHSRMYAIDPDAPRDPIVDDLAWAIFPFLIAALYAWITRSPKT